MDEQQEQQALNEIAASLESTISWMRKRQPSDWAKAQVPGEPHRYGTLSLYLLLRIEALLSEMNERQIKVEQEWAAELEKRRQLAEARGESRSRRRHVNEEEL